MRLLVPTLRGRISPVLDVARNFLLVDKDVDGKTTHRELLIENTQITTRAKKIVELGTQVLICGAISWPLEALLVSAGVQLIPNTCGVVQEVIEVFLSGEFTAQAFLMPGCCGKRRRRQNQHSRDKRGRL